MPEPNLPPLRLLELGIDPSEYRSRIPTLPEEHRKMLVEKYQLGLDTAVQIVVSFLNKIFKLEFLLIVQLFPLERRTPALFSTSHGNPPSFGGEASHQFIAHRFAWTS